MSEGNFSRSRYETDDGSIHGIRVQPETLALTIGGTANAAPTGAIDADGLVKVSKGKREFGIGARTVTIVFNEGAAPEGYKENSPIRLPILTPAMWDGVSTFETGTYLGAAVTVVGKGAESIR